MAEFLAHKFVSSLPTPLTPNSVYFVRVGGGFDLHVTNNAGEIVAYTLNVAREAVVGVGFKREQVLTRAEYNALNPVDAQTLYHIIE